MTTSSITKSISPPDSFRSLSAKRILIVDDEPLIVRLTAAFLQKGGFTDVRTETDSRKVIDVLNEFHPDLLLLDISMPHISGLDLLAQIGAKPEFDNIAVLMLSSAGRKAESKSYDLGALGFVPKPSSSDEIIRIVSSTLRVVNRFGSR